jgi:superfamily II DNA or RNA helicase
VRVAPASEVRASIAALVLGAEHRHSPIGDITLHAHQREGAERVSRLLNEHGGALLADAVGLGKTFVALAVARGAREPWVVAPAALRELWMDAARRGGVALRFVSVEALGRRGAPRADPDLVVIDEAHHLRSSRTRRFAAARELCASARVLLMSATPIQNRLSDLRVILSLFLGSRAEALTEDELARFIVRRVERDVSSSRTMILPALRPPEWLPAVHDADCLDRIVALPAPLPPSDGDDGGVLLTYTLVRQWASSRAALEGALLRRVAGARAMEDALVAGRLPSRDELTAWCFEDGAQQLVFPEIAVQSPLVTSAIPLLAQLRRHLSAIRELLAWMETSADPDDARAETLRDVLAAHAGERIVAFSEYADTVSALYRRLAPKERVAMLTHRGGRVAGGPVSRRDLLARFAPDGAPVPASDRIDLLLTTDVLSEGVNLQRASVVVHLDLSWNPARLEQRVGRLRRIGATRSHVFVYMFAPPAAAERMLQLERRLRQKLGVAARSLGLAGAILPELRPPDPRAASTSCEESIAAALRSWRGGRMVKCETPLAGCVGAPRNGAIACFVHDGSASLVALSGDRVGDARADVAAMVADAGGHDVILEAGVLHAVRARVEQWARRHAVSDVVNRSALHAAHARRELLRRVDTIAGRVPRHTQPRLAPLIRAARTAATARLSAGAERVLEQLSEAAMSDEAWLSAVGEFAALNARATDVSSPVLQALLILRAD